MTHPNDAASPFGPDSMMWRINRERVVLLGGAAAAVLQAAHPVVAAGVAKHSRFRTDPTSRLRHTLEAVYAVAFGGAAAAEAVRRHVANAHKKVQGPSYSANDPNAQLWVLATLIMCSVTQYERFVGPLTETERDRFLEENAHFGEYFGLDSRHLPQPWTAFQEYWSTMIDGDFLGQDPLCGEVARAVIRPDAPRHMRWLAPVTHALVLEYIPEPLRKRLGLKNSRLRRPFWKCLDRAVPSILRQAPKRIRYPSSYLHAIAQFP